jgi:hypothetical protein
MSVYTLRPALHRVRIALVIAGSISNVLVAAGEKSPTDAKASEQSSKTNAVAVNAPLTARDVRGATAMIPLAEEPPAKIILDPPLPELLARGMALIQFRTENLRLFPAFGPAALNVSPRIGHLHVRLDDNPWVWAHTSGDDLIVNRLLAGPHKIQVELANANHNILAKGVVQFEVPQGTHTAAFPREHEINPDLNPKDRFPSKLFVESPEPDRLARGVAFIQYRTENSQIAQLFGTAALDISPRICHLHVTVDDARWRWAHTSGGPLILADLPAGPHKILIELVNAEHKPIANSVVTFVVPQSSHEHPDTKVSGEAAGGSGVGQNHR